MEYWLGYRGFHNALGVSRASIITENQSLQSLALSTVPHCQYMAKSFASSPMLSWQSARSCFLKNQTYILMNLRHGPHGLLWHMTSAFPSLHFLKTSGKLAWHPSWEGRGAQPWMEGVDAYRFLGRWVRICVCRWKSASISDQYNGYETRSAPSLALVWTSSDMSWSCS